MFRRALEEWFVQQSIRPSIVAAICENAREGLFGW